MNEWKTVKIGEICEQINGVSYKPADVYDSLTEKATILLRANNIFEDKLNYDELVFVDKKRISENQYMKKGDILICASSGSKHLVGKAACLTEDKDLTFGAFCKVLRPKTVNPEYIKHYFFSPSYRTEISRLSEGANINNIKAADLDNLKIPLPSESIQNKIAKRLDKCVKIINNQRKALEKYDILIKSRFIEMFGDNPIENGKWKVEKLGNLGLCKNGMNFSYEDNGFEINCLGVGDFKDNAVISNCEKLPVISLNEKPSEEYLLKDNDIVFVRSNGNKELVGRSVLVHPRVLTTFSGFCIRFRLSTDSINHLFLLQFLKMPNTRKNMAGRGANIQNLNQQILSNLDIPVPPIELQNDFATFVQQIDKSKFEIANSLKRLYNKGMLS